MPARFLPAAPYRVRVRRVSTRQGRGCPAFPPRPAGCTCACIPSIPFRRALRVMLNSRRWSAVLVSARPMSSAKSPPTTGICDTPLLARAFAMVCHVSPDFPMGASSLSRRFGIVRVFHTIVRRHCQTRYCCSATCRAGRKIPGKISEAVSAGADGSAKEHCSGKRFMTLGLSRRAGIINKSLSGPGLETVKVWLIWGRIWVDTLDMG